MNHGFAVTQAVILFGRILSEICMTGLKDGYCRLYSKEQKCFLYV